MSGYFLGAQATNMQIMEIIPTAPQGGVNALGVLVAAARMGSNAVPLWAKNITAVKGGTGLYDYTFDTPLSGANYIVSGMAESGSAFIVVDAPTANGFTIRVRIDSGGFADVQHQIQVTDYN